MKEIKNKRLIGVISILIIFTIISLITYGKNKNKIFKDEYMKTIFVDDSEQNGESDIFYEEKDEEITTVKTIQEQNTIFVEIKGEVIKPDVYVLTEGSIIKDLIDASGGLTSEADISNINRAKELQNHELIIIGNVNNKDEVNNINAINESTISGGINGSNDGIININTASESELKTIPGVGDVKAKAIIDYREANNGFKAIDEIKNIDGIGDKTFEKIKDKIKL